MDKEFKWVQVGGSLKLDAGKDWTSAFIDEKFTHGRKNMRITLDVPLVEINTEDDNVISDLAIRFISEDCDVITLKTPDGNKYRLDHDMLKKAIEVIGEVNC